MATIELSRTLVKSRPEIWAELESSAGLSDAVGGASVLASRPEHWLRWEGERASGTAVLEPCGLGTKVTLTARLHGPGSPRDRPAGGGGQSPDELERRLAALLDHLGAAHRRPFLSA